MLSLSELQTHLTMRFMPNLLVYNADISVTIGDAFVHVPFVIKFVLLHAIFVSYLHVTVAELLM